METKGSYPEGLGHLSQFKTCSVCCPHQEGCSMKVTRPEVGLTGHQGTVCSRHTIEVVYHWMFPNTHLLVDTETRAIENNEAYQNQEEKCPPSCNVFPASTTNKT